MLFCEEFRKFSQSRERQRERNPKRKNVLCQGTKELLLWTPTEVAGPATKFELNFERDDAPRG